MAVKLSALCAGRPPFPPPPRKIPGTHFCQRLSGPQGHSASGRIRSIEKSNNLIGNRTRDLPVCNIELQPTTLPRAPTFTHKWAKSVGALYMPKTHFVINCFIRRAGVEVASYVRTVVFGSNFNRATN
jgi:hypothetical protein